MWEIKRSDEFHQWIQTIDDDAKEAIFKHLSILKKIGPTLGRPFVDTIKGSSIKNLKELRVQSKNRVIRVFFVFDPERNILLILGGDKKGNSRFYQEMVPQVEKLYKIYLSKMGESDEKKNKTE